MEGVIDLLAWTLVYLIIFWYLMSLTNRKFRAESEHEIIAVLSSIIAVIFYALTGAASVFTILLFTTYRIPLAIFKIIKGAFLRAKKESKE